MTAKVSRTVTRDYVLEDPIRLTPVDEARNRLYRRWAVRSLVLALTVVAVVATLRHASAVGWRCRAGGRQKPRSSC